MRQLHCLHELVSLALTLKDCNKAINKQDRNKEKKSKPAGNISIDKNIFFKSLKLGITVDIVA